MEKRKKFLGLEKRYQILLFSGIGAIILIFIGLLLIKSENTTLYGIFLGAGVIVGFVPYSITEYIRKKNTMAIEDELPNFLRDIAESKKTGMTLPQAVYRSAKIDYGKLSSEVRKMSNQISWGIPFNEVLDRFAKRSGSRFIQRAIAIIVEAQKSGGAIADTLDSVANDARLIKESEAERKSKLSQQAMIMYAIFYLFLAIVIALKKLLVPLLQTKGFALATGDPEEILAFFNNLFFSMIVIQAIFNGVLAGQIGEGSVIVGLKHSAIFLVSGVLVSILFLF